MTRYWRLAEKPLDSDADSRVWEESHYEEWQIEVQVLGLGDGGRQALVELAVVDLDQTSGHSAPNQCYCCEAALQWWTPQDQ
jgi:hypothetical protein